MTTKCKPTTCASSDTFDAEVKTLMLDVLRDL